MDRKQKEQSPTNQCPPTNTIFNVFVTKDETNNNNELMKQLIQNKRLRSELHEQEEDEHFIRNNKKRKVIPSFNVVKLNNKCIQKVFSFFETREIIGFNLVCHQWKTICDKNIRDFVSPQVSTISKELYKNSQIWSTNSKCLEVAALIKQKKPKEAVKVLKTFVPLKKYLIDITHPDTFYIDNIFEYFMLRFGNDVYPKDDTLILNASKNYMKPMNQLVYAITEQNTHDLSIQLVDKIIEKYNPISIFLRLEKIECLKVKKNFKDIYYGTYECLKLSHKLKDIAKCYRNFAFYFIEYDKIECAIACLCKSAQFDVHISIVQELNHIQQKNLKIKLDNIDKDQPKSFIYMKTNVERNKIQSLYDLCESLKKDFIDFMCKHRLIPMSEKLTNFVPPHARRYLLSEIYPFRNNRSVTSIIISNGNTRNTISKGHVSARLSTRIVFNNNNNDSNEDDSSDDDDNDNILGGATVCEPISNNFKTISGTKEERESFPVFQFSNEQLYFIEKHLKNCRPLAEHEDKDLIPVDQMTLEFSDRLMLYYKFLIAIIAKNEKDKKLFYMDMKISKSKNQKLSEKEMQELNLTWNSFSFFTLNQVKHIYNVLNESRKKSGYEMISYLLDLN